jgi:hypothetical protein
MKEMNNVLPTDNFFLTKPRILTGESISGYIARVSAFASQGGIGMTLRYQNKPEQRLPWLLPSRLQQLSQLYGLSVPSAEELMMNHTIFPLLRPFLPEKAVQSLKNHFLEEFVPGIALICGFGPQGLAARWTTAVCRECLAEDSNEGMTFWRTAHLVPGLALCPFHLVPLYTYCDTCTSGFRSSRKIWLPRLNCFCGKELRQIRILSTEAERRAEASLSAMVKQILTAKILSTVEHSGVLSATSRRAREFGYGGPGGLANILERVDKRIAAATLNAYRLGTSRRSQFHSSLSGASLPRHPMHNLLLIYALFDGMEDFVETLRCNDENSKNKYFYRGDRKIRRRIGRPQCDHLYKRSEEELQTLRLKYRNWLLKLKSENANVKRGDLRSINPREAYVFLLRFDKQWLDMTLPCLPSFGPTSLATRRSRQARRDHVLATHVFIRYQMLIKSSVPIQITHRRLLEGQPLQAMPKSYFERFPETKLALKNYTELSEAWRRRQTQYLIDQAFKVSSDAPFEKNLELSKLSFGKIKRLKEKIRKWLRQQKGDF